MWVNSSVSSVSRLGLLRVECDAALKVGVIVVR